MATRPENIGIKAIEIYFPSQYVEQSELETFDGVSSGKYTIGLGQTKMAFCDDREDIYSFALTVTSNLLKKYNVDPNSIGRLEVGTETILDKSKSVKTVLMQLFGDNTNIEGVDTVNACYGGTNAFFNTVNWIESSAWDGRDAIVVAGDIALYAKGNARPTGGAGAVALLVGPNAPVVVDAGLRGTYMQHAYDFYKPDLTSEYPYVDGHYSLTCYTKALDAAYRDYNKREARLAKAANGTNSHANGANGDSAKLPKTSIDRFDYLAFHAPNCKLVQKSYGRLLYHDYLADADNSVFAEVAPELRDMDYEKSLTDKVVEKTFMALTKKKYQERVVPGIQVATLCGNMYCGSVWGGIASILSHVDAAALQGKRIGAFSYGSGLAASFMSFRVKGDVSKIAKTLDIPDRLEARRQVSPETYDALCNLRKKAHLQKDFTPEGDASTITPGTYYLEKVDDKFQRSYSVKA
ncbi:Hydroxymethylglutaryl-CoA synthase [Colletotrichum sidae]|uniref:Hydroxymethylglutaryl-CoA synthase n=4 Tax=Colletotrichum orbiculare species complex TaxID=2707354 RepID=N4VBG5_COLOR|nr:Hydroxymethylglutaryl-CoA synthase [Colletotrichum orbiculare MAFF 240422]TDZ28200.1 Hydroxymethylglutaryl-CoA synthase [Colletotrichum spinosum]TDZ32827.1 Hydroxymethylglutaryl-CoA synthase [Colletotrichum trifolii]TDZ91748.1 Hydroxymethylglutaryl-CoA synthase [Colletotrichum sidae]